MAKVTSFVYCLNASRMITADGKGEMINAEGVLSTITPEYVNERLSDVVQNQDLTRYIL